MVEQLKRGREREKRKHNANRTGAEVIQTSGNGENETKEGYIYIRMEGTTLPPLLRAKQLFPTNSGG